MDSLREACDTPAAAAEVGRRVVGGGVGIISSNSIVVLIGGTHDAGSGGVFLKGTGARLIGVLGDATCSTLMY